MGCKVLPGKNFTDFFDRNLESCLGFGTGNDNSGSCSDIILIQIQIHTVNTGSDVSF